MLFEEREEKLSQSHERMCKTGGMADRLEIGMCMNVTRCLPSAKSARLRDCIWEGARQGGCRSARWIGSGGKGHALAGEG